MITPGPLPWTFGSPARWKLETHTGRSPSSYTTWPQKPPSDAMEGTAATDSIVPVCLEKGSRYLLEIHVRFNEGVLRAVV